MSDAVVYTSRVRIERIKGSLRRAFVPVDKEPFFFSVHDEIAEHYKTDLSIIPPHAATLDYVVAATAG